MFFVLTTATHLSMHHYIEPKLVFVFISNLGNKLASGDQDGKIETSYRDHSPGPPYVSPLLQGESRMKQRKKINEETEKGWGVEENQVQEGRKE